MRRRAKKQDDLNYLMLKTTAYAPVVSLTSTRPDRQRQRAKGQNIPASEQYFRYSSDNSDRANFFSSIVAANQYAENITTDITSVQTDGAATIPASHVIVYAV